MAVKIGSVVKLAIKHGPKVGIAATAVGAFLSKNPEVAAWLRARLTRLPKQLAEARKRRGDAEQIRGILEIVRDVAGTLRTDEATEVVAAGWLKRADDIALGVQLAERLGQPERSKALARLKVRAETLLAELIEATTGE